MTELDLRAYRAAFGAIHGAFTLDAALLFFAYGALSGARGPVLEIGVHHGLSAIAVAALRAPGAPMVAIDTFGTSTDVVASGGMSTDQRTFLANMARFHGDSAFVRVIASDSRALRPSDVGSGFIFCHVDGGHSAQETAHDLALAAAVAAPGALVALDDYFNPSFPGVSEGTLRYLIDHPDALVPLAIGANKVLFRRGGAGDLNARFAERYPFIPRTRAVFSASEVLVFGSGVVPYVDLDRSGVSEIVARDVVLRAEIRPERSEIAAAAGATVPLAVRVGNRSNIPLAWSDSPHGLSYHLLREDGTPERFENARTWFIPPLAEGEERSMTLSLVAPERPGRYVVELDVVWEGICWLRERGSLPARVTLTVG